MLMPVSRKPATDLGILAHQFFSAIDIAEVSGRHVMEKARSLLSQLGRRDRIAEPEAAWTAKAEYLFVDLANASCGFTNCSGTNTTVSLNENILRASINFKFGGGWW
jgi:hypothetical protein